MDSAKSASELDWKEMTFTRILHDMNETGSFRASFLVDAQGLPVAAVTSSYDTDTASAMAALVRNVIEQAQTRINLAEADEVTVRDNDKIRLVSRYFAVGDETLILVVVAPPYRSYRRLTNRAIKALRAAWAS
jgi:predicted regulator of Ras-like GTPase activity (Roadblock/LC7/MglB family)